MNDIIPFLINHFILSSLFILLLGAVIYVEMIGGAKGVKKISPQEAIHLINREQALVVDLRDAAAYKAGHIVNAVQITPSELLTHKKLEGKVELNIILVCASGTQSPAQAAHLSKKGFLKVFYIGGGMGAWRAENLPVVK